MMKLIGFVKVFFLKDHTELGGTNMVFVNDTCLQSGSSDLPQPITTSQLHKLLIKCSWWQGLAWGLLVRGDTSSAVFKQRRHVVS